MNKKEINPKKLELIELSAFYRKLREKKLKQAKTKEELFFWERQTINSLILAKYQKESGTTVFKTFNNWINEGYKVKKGESGWIIFYKKLMINHCCPPLGATSKKYIMESYTVEMFERKICTIFDGVQVEDSQINFDYALYSYKDSKFVEITVSHSFGILFRHLALLCEIVRITYLIPVGNELKISAFLDNIELTDCK